MKIKNKHIYFSLLVFFNVLMGCKPAEPEETLTVSVASISASALRNTYDVTVTTSNTDFSISTDVEWLTTNDITKTSFVIVVAANNVTTSRKGYITVSSGSKSVKIAINQAAGVYVPITLTPTNRDSLALVALNTGTAKWNTTQSINTWSGVKVDVIAGYRRVTELNIPAANISTGIITDSIKNLTELIYLDLSNSNLSGTIPALSTLSKLVVLDLKNNKLSGNIPLLPISLAYLSLGQNNLSGILPTQIKDLSSLQILDVGLNDLSGSIPTEWSSLSKLKYYYLYGNQITATIPSYISSFVKLEALAFDYNKLTGNIPSGIGAIASLKKLTLQQNLLTGSIPADLLNNLNWSTWSTTVLPQQNGTTLSGAPAVNGAKLRIRPIPYELPNNRMYVN